MYKYLIVCFYYNYQECIHIIGRDFNILLHFAKCHVALIPTILKISYLFVYTQVILNEQVMTAFSQRL